MRNADIAKQIPLSEATAILVEWTEALGLKVTITRKADSVVVVGIAGSVTFESRISGAADDGAMHTAVAALAEMFAKHLESTPDFTSSN